MTETQAKVERPLPLTPRGRRARAAIIDAAASLMYQGGVRATSLDDILAAAGSGKSQLYHYFTDRAELVSAVIDRQLELVLANQPVLQRIDSWAALEEWMTQILDIHSLPGGPFACPLGTMAAELKNDETYRPALDAAFRAWEAPLARGLQIMRDRGDLVPTSDPARLAAVTIAALQGGMLLSRVHDDIGPLHDALDGALYQLRRYATPRRRSNAMTARSAKRR